MPGAVPAPLGVLERASKAAAHVSVLLIVVLQLVVHPDITAALQVVGAAAFVVGWLAGGSRDSPIHTIWLLVAPLAPAFLHLLTGREGPVLDVIWMAGLAGSLLRNGDWVRWNLPIAWRVLLGGWALTLSLAWPVLVAREIGFDFRGLYDLGAINSWAMLSAPQVVAWTAYVVLSQLLGLLWLDWVVSRFGNANRLPRIVHGLWIGATIASLIAIYQGTIDLSFLSTPPWAALGRATGTLLDANAYGVLAALAGPVAFVVLRSIERPRLAVSVLAVNVLGMWMSGSRTALVCAIAGASGLAISLLRQPRQSPNRIAAGAIVAAILVVIVAAATAVGPWRRLADVPLTRAGAALAWNRGPYGPIAIEMIRAHPLTGVGVGSYHVLAPDYWRVEANQLLPFDNAQNWWRHQAAELGLLGALPVMAWSILLAWRVVAGRARSEDAAGFTVRGVLLGLGLISVLGMPTQNPAVLLWFFFLVAWLNRVTEESRLDMFASRWAAAAAVVAVVMSVAHASGQVVLARSSLAVAERAKLTHRDYVAGAYVPESLPSGSQFRWTDDESRFVWAAKTRWLVVRIWAQHPDIADRPVRVTLATACQTVFDEELHSPEPISLGLELPEGTRAVEVVVRVSRTWQPSNSGVADTRRLGAAILADFASGPERGLEQTRAVELKDCR